MIKTVGVAKSLKNNCGFDCTNPHYRNCTSENLVGIKFNMLTVLKISDSTVKGNIRLDCICDCGALITVNSGDLKNGNTKSCGCWRRYISSARSGPNNHWYNHDLSEEERVHRRATTKYNTWIRNVKDRDNYTCQICGFKGSKHDGKIQAHHLNSYKLFPDERNVVDNGISLCNTCHKAFHSFYGKITNKEQLLQFIHDMIYKSDWLVYIYSDKLKNLIKDLKF